MWFQLQLASGLQMAVFVDAKGLLWWNRTDVSRLLDLSYVSHCKRIRECIPRACHDQFNLMQLNMLVISDVQFQRMLKFLSPWVDMHLTRLFREGKVWVTPRNPFSWRCGVLVQECNIGNLTMQEFLKEYRQGVVQFYRHVPERWRDASGFHNPGESKLVHSVSLPGYKVKIYTSGSDGMSGDGGEFEKSFLKSFKSESKDNKMPYMDCAFGKNKAWGGRNCCETQV